MPSDTETLISFENKLKIREYAEGCRLYELICGSSKGREWKASVFFFTAMIMLFILMTENFNIAKVPVCAIVLLICMYMCSHYIYMLPRKAKLTGEHVYKSSKLLSKPYRFEIYRNCIVMKNKFEYLKRYYSEINECIETDEIFVLIGGFEHRIIVISKRCITDEQSEKLSEHFRNEMIKHYRRIKSNKKGRAKNEK